MTKSCPERALLAPSLIVRSILSLTKDWMLDLVAKGTVTSIPTAAEPLRGPSD